MEQWKLRECVCVYVCVYEYYIQCILYGVSSLNEYTNNNNNNNKQQQTKITLKRASQEEKRIERISFGTQTHTFITHSYIEKIE